MRGYGLVSTIWAACLTSATTTGQQAPAFDAPILVNADGADFAAAVDFDGDGDLDRVESVAASAGSYQLRLVRNDGAAGFAAPTPAILVGPGLTAPPSVRPADFDGDAFGDLLVRTSGLDYFVSDGIGGFIAVAAYAGPVGAAVVGDADGDGDDDVFCTEPSASGDVARVLRNDGDGAYAVPTVSSPLILTAPVQGVVAAELTGDGACDVAVAMNGVATDTVVQVLSYAGGGLFTAGSHGLGGLYGFAPSPANPSALAVGDIDGDGDADLTASGVSGLGTPVMQVLRRYPFGLSLEPTSLVGVGAGAFVDMDADGDPDAVQLSGTEASGFVDYEPATLFVFRNEGGSFAPWARWSLVGKGPFAVADFDGDGDMDVFAGRCAYLGRGALRPTAPAMVSLNAITGFVAAFPEPRGAALDVDLDGDPDFEVGYPTTQASPLNDGAGGASANLPAFPTAPAGTVYVGPGFCGDFDGDGFADLLVERRVGTSVVAASVYLETVLLRNVGGRSFVAAGAATPPGARIYQAPMFPTAPPVAASAAVYGDVDGDGDLDLVSRPSGLVPGPAFDAIVWRNDGSGFFTAVETLTGAYPLACADLNADGRADLLTGEVVQFTTPRVRLAAPGGGFGSFSGVAALAGAGFDRLARPALADFDDDGDVDVALWCAATAAGGSAVYDPELRLLWNAGDGTFPTSTTVDAPVLVARLEALAADVNGDGLTDLLTSAEVTPPMGPNPNVNTAAVFRSITAVRIRTGPGAFAPPITQMFRAVAADDADGDGDVDALGAVVVRNVRFDGAAAGSRRQYGLGYPGTGGAAPTLGAVGPFRGGATGALRVRGAVGGAGGLLVVGAAPASLPTPFGGDLLTTPDVLLPFAVAGPAGSAGAGAFDLPITFPSGMGGFAAYLQAAVLDPGATFGLSATEGLELVFGP